MFASISLLACRSRSVISLNVSLSFLSRLRSLCNSVPLALSFSKLLELFDLGSDEGKLFFLLLSELLEVGLERKNELADQLEAIVLSIG